ncbi:unnamed protein product [Dibothriocephalus latus]|uniref:Cyclin N-terminal domain-containing protein n=1 Tax=Dibothriocephalus latus TaxID=60516 RepID=A0A3P6U0V7_DIBLA|nr:unnamed protein product [Dibothriocephalus latus]
MASNVSSHQPEVDLTDLPEVCSKHLPNRIFGRIQRKFSVPSQRLREQAACLGRRASKKLKQVNNPPGSNDSLSLGFDLGGDPQEDQLSSPDRKANRKRKLTKRTQRDSPYPERNNRIDRMFQVMRKGRSLELPDDVQVKNFEAVHEGPLPACEKENKDATSLPTKKCIECVRRLMERQTLADVEQRSATASLLEEKIIPEGTRQAFGLFNGCWINTYAAVRDRLYLSTLSNNDDADQGEFYLFYKRILHYLLIRDAILSLDFEPTCLSRSQLTPGIRATLFDWMIKVQQYLRMGTESLHLATSLVDYFISRRQIAEHNYQLVGITALFLAGKVNERQAASLRTLCYLTEHSYIPKQVGCPPF